MTEATADSTPLLRTLRSLTIIPGMFQGHLNRSAGSGSLNSPFMCRLARSCDPYSAFFFFWTYSIASRTDIQTLDLYGLLTSLPKTEELEEPDAPGQEGHFAMEKSDDVSSGQHFAHVLVARN
jgi:hypothetical protein